MYVSRYQTLRSQTRTYKQIRRPQTHTHTHILNKIHTFSPDKPGKDVCDPNLEKAKLTESQKNLILNQPQFLSIPS